MVCKYLFSFATDIPVFPTVTAIVTLDKYECCSTPAEVFQVPSDYVKVGRDYSTKVRIIGG